MYRLIFVIRANILINDDNKAPKNNSSNTVSDKETTEVVVPQENGGNENTLDVGGATENNKNDNIHKKTEVRSF